MSVNTQTKAYTTSCAALELIQEGRSINLFQLQINSGYSKKSALAYKVVKTRAWKEKVIPVVHKMQETRGEIIDAMVSKDLNKEKLSDLSQALRNINRDIHLLGG